MYNNVIKSKSNETYYMLRQSFITATEWCQLSASEIYKRNQIVTDTVEEIINKMCRNDSSINTLCNDN